MLRVINSLRGCYCFFRFWYIRKYCEISLFFEECMIVFQIPAQFPEIRTMNPNFGCSSRVFYKNGKNNKQYVVIRSDPSLCICVFCCGGCYNSCIIPKNLGHSSGSWLQPLWKGATRHQHRCYRKPDVSHSRDLLISMVRLTFNHHHLQAMRSTLTGLVATYALIMFLLRMWSNFCHL